MFSSSWSLAVHFWLFSIIKMSLGSCERPSWSTIVWDISPEDLEIIRIQSHSTVTCLPYPLNRVCWADIKVDLFQDYMQILCVPCRVLSFVALGITIIFLWILYKKSKQKVNTP
ncbi:hypothetical protein FKM82_023611 [Ascaphus truei]